MTFDAVTAFPDGGELGQRIRSYGWTGSPIGPLAAWPISLQTVVGIMLGSKQPMFTVWGADYTLLFNDAYRSILGHKDAGALGRSFLEIWSEARADLQPLVERAYSGESVHMDDITLMIDREGLDPEAHFAFSYTPIRGNGGHVDGFFCACSETTDMVMARRRQAFRLRLEAALWGLDDADEIVRSAGRVLGQFLGANRIGFGEVSADGQQVTIETAYIDGMDALSGTFAIADFGKQSGDRLHAGETIVVGDVTLETDSDQALWQSTQARSYAAVPIMRNGRLSATLFANFAARRHLSAKDEALMRAVAVRVSDSVQRVRAEMAAQASAARFRTLTEAIPNQVWTARTDGVIDWFNERTGSYLGQSDVVGRTGWNAFIHPDDRGLASTRWADALESGDVFEVEYRLRRYDDVYRWHLVRSVPERDFGGRVIRWVGTNTDIDDQKRAELDLIAAKAAADEANLAKSTFIANMSHELRTPLSAIIGYSEMMAEEIADGCSAEDVASDLGKVEGNARHLLGLINDVLDLSKIESGKMEAFAEDFEVEPMLRELSTTVEGLVAKRGNRFALEIGAGLGTAHTDLVKVRQMLLNLLSNAAKFTENGTITLEAGRETGSAGDVFVFVVRDDGIGMTQEQLNKLFQRFTQADTSTTRKFGGTGLGLSLTKAFSEMLGGSISVVSGEGTGSAFTLRMPVRFVPPQEVETAPDPMPVAEASSRNLVLVIDDDADQRTLMTRFLHREGFDVQVAADGRTGLTLAQQLKPRAVLLDLLMPGVDGWSVLTQLKADPALTDIPVVMVTSVDQRSLAASLGAAEYMLKPVQWDRFRTVMDRFKTAQGGVLLVEDDSAARQVIRNLLEEDGWTVDEASDGQEGLARAAAKTPDVILTDLNMPVVDGFDFLDQLRRLPNCADVPVIVLTARDLTREDRRRLRGGSQILNKGDVKLKSLVERLYKLAETHGREVVVSD